LDREFRTAIRTNLDEHSWVDLTPGWISGSDELFRQIATEADWAQHWRRMFKQVFREPRFTAAFDSIEQAPVSFIGEIADALHNHYGVRYDSLWMNFYCDEHDGSGWQADRFGTQADKTFGTEDQLELPLERTELTSGTRWPGVNA
jgi:hypothetical protein